LLSSLLRRASLEKKIFISVIALSIPFAIAGMIVLYGLFFPATSNTYAGPSVMTALYISLAVLFVAAGLILTGRVARYVTRPLVTLTHITDEISQDKLDVEIRFGEPVRCWEIKGCTQKECHAYGNTAVQCWFVDGTPCEGVEPRFPQKLAHCRNCDVYQAHKGDEIVQLADSFRHMTHQLKLSHGKLEESYSFQKNLIMKSFDGIIATDEQGTVVLFNRAAEKLTDFSAQEVIGKRFWRAFFTENPWKNAIEPMDGEVSPPGSFPPRESVVLGRDNRSVPVLLSGIKLFEEDRMVGRVMFFQDLREINRLRRDLIQAERLAATGQTVASISHSVKNILNGLQGGIFIYNRGRKKGDECKLNEGWDMIERNVELISELVTNLLNFAKERTPKLEECDPNKIVRDVCRVYEQKAISRKIQLIHNTDGVECRAMLDAHAVHQCLMNLVSNAMDAIPEDHPGQVELSTRIENGARVMFVVKDDGDGIPEEIRGKLFEGLFSTKGSKGTGLGLLSTQKTIKELGGSLDFYTEVGKGTTFKISLPLFPKDTVTDAGAEDSATT